MQYAALLLLLVEAVGKGLLVGECICQALLVLLRALYLNQRKDREGRLRQDAMSLKSDHGRAKAIREPGWKQPMFTLPGTTP